MLKLKTFAAAILAAGALSACDIEGAIDDLEKQAIDAAFQTIQDAARQKGGDAVLVRPGAEYVIEINNPQSPINGAKVVIPAAAIPTDVEQAAVAIYGIDNGGAVKSTDSHKLVGPVASIGFTKLPGAEEVEPLANLNITLPYTESATAPAEQIVLINVNGDASLLEFEGSAATGGKATGGSKKYNLFGAFWEVDYDGTSDAPEGSLIYKVTSSDGSKSCAGLIENVNERITEKSYRYQGAGYSFLIAVSPTLTIDTTSDATAVPYSPPTAVPAPISHAGPYGSWLFSCAGLDGTALGGNVQTLTLGSLNFSNWVEASAGTSETCGANACTPRTGSVDFDFALDAALSDGSTVKAKMNTTINDFVWTTEP